MKDYQEFLIELSLGKAGAFAAKQHTDQFRKVTGAPYIVHPTAVVRILQKHGVKDKDVLVAAFLHDTIEDTPTTYNMLRNEFNKTVADLVKEVTSNTGAIERYGKPEYLAHKMLKMSDNALLIKLADRIHNLQDLSSMDDRKASSLKIQTKYIVDAMRARNLNGTHKKLIREIIRRIE